jgi:hypothetical protein
MKLALSEYLGSDVSRLLASEPFSRWRFTRSVEEDLPKKEVWYEFHERSVEVICDENETIRTIFLHAGVDQVLAVIPFELTRQQVLDRFGSPSQSGAPMRDPVLGAYGPWDRFTSDNGTVHIEYRVDADSIKLISLIRSDAVP